MRLLYHFRNSDYVDNSLIKLKSHYCPKRYEHKELEKVISSLERTNIRITRTRDNIPSQRQALKLITKRIESGEIIIKPADKGSITVIMDPLYYLQMCLRHLEDENYYTKCSTDPSETVKQRMTEFANKYANTLTRREFEYLTKASCKMSNIYMLPKLHKSPRIDEIIKHEQKQNTPL